MFKLSIDNWKACIGENNLKNIGIPRSKDIPKPVKDSSAGRIPKIKISDFFSLSSGKLFIDNTRFFKMPCLFNIEVM